VYASVGNLLAESLCWSSTNNLGIYDITVECSEAV